MRGTSHTADVMKRETQSSLKHVEEVAGTYTDQKVLPLRVYEFNNMIDTIVDRAAV